LLTFWAGRGRRRSAYIVLRIAGEGRIEHGWGGLDGSDFKIGTEKEKTYRTPLIYVGAWLNSCIVFSPIMYTRLPTILNIAYARSVLAVYLE